MSDLLNAGATTALALAPLTIGQGVSAWMRLWRQEYRQVRGVWRWVWRRR